jgi:dihydroneopterin aldolase
MTKPKAHYCAETAPAGFQDQLKLSGMEFFARHGVLPQERQLGQRFLVDCTLCLDLEAAASCDDLAAGLDYAAVYQVVEATVTAHKQHQLIESLAHAVVQCVLAEFAQVQQVEVTVHKPQAPLPGIVADVSATLRRKRS